MSKVPSNRLKVFLNYPKERREEAERVYRFLRSVEIEVWFDQESLIGGQNWERERTRVQTETDIFLAICSEETTSRNGVVQREINQALELLRDRRPDTIFIIPLRTKDIPVPRDLTPFQWIDLFEASWPSRLARSLAVACEQAGREKYAALEVAAASQSSGNLRTLTLEPKSAKGDLHLSWVEYDDHGQYWDYVNGVIRGEALGGLYEAQRHMADWDHDGSYWELQVSEFHRRGQLVSLTAGGSEYYAGAAHPNHRVFTVNLFGEACGRVGIEDLFGHNPETLKLLIAYCAVDLKRQSLDEDYQEVVERYAEENGWTFFSQFNVNDLGLVFNFSPQTGLPHVLGVFDVYVPWEPFKTRLSPAVRAFLAARGLPVGE